MLGHQCAQQEPQRRAPREADAGAVVDGEGAAVVEDVQHRRPAERGERARVLPSGEVLIVGGVGATDVLKSAELAVP